MDASVVIPTYKGIGTLRDCLNAVFSCNGNFEVIVIHDKDENSTKEIAEDFSKKFSNRFRCLENRAGRGPGGARNTGIINAKGDVVIFVDDDIIAQTKDLVELHVKAAKNYDLVVGKNIPCPPNYLINVMKVGNENRTSFFVWANGSMRKEIALQNLFLEDVELGTEDDELKKRLQKKGYKRYYLENAVCKHILDQGLISLYKEGWRRGITNRTIPVWKSLLIVLGGVLYTSAKYTWSARKHLKLYHYPVFYIMHITGSWLFNFANLIGKTKSTLMPRS